MSDLTVAASFTKNAGQPATGLTLAEINLYLTAQNRETGAAAVVWDGTQHPTVEMANVGAYVAIYAGADLDSYNYHAAAEYTGVEVLDMNWVTGAAGVNEIPLGTAVAWTYRVTNSVSGLPIEGVRVQVSTDAAGTNVIRTGYTNADGYAKDVYGNDFRLDPGTYYFWCLKSGIDFNNPDTEVVN